jgi:Flp pilus assembly pilin Flp
MTHLLKRLWSGSDGQSLSEYALLLLMVSLVAVAGMGGLASSVGHVYLRTSARVVTAGSLESIRTQSAGDLGFDQVNRAVTTQQAQPAPDGRVMYERPHPQDGASQ